jgi:hypothetical protein
MVQDAGTSTDLAADPVPEDAVLPQLEAPLAPWKRASDKTGRLSVAEVRERDRYEQDRDRAIQLLAQELASTRAQLGDVKAVNGRQAIDLIGNRGVMGEQRQAIEASRRVNDRVLAQIEQLRQHSESALVIVALMASAARVPLDSLKVESQQGHQQVHLKVAGVSVLYQVKENMVELVLGWQTSRPKILVLDGGRLDAEQAADVRRYFKSRRPQKAPWTWTDITASTGPRRPLL